jgi:hypothetical protein
MAERQRVLPPENGSLRCWSPISHTAYGSAEWHWQVILERNNVLASGVATTSVAARKAAMGYCLEQQDEKSEK